MQNHTQESKEQQYRKQSDKTSPSNVVSNELRKFIFFNVPIGIFRSTPYFTGDFVLANPTLVEMFGYSDLKSFLEVPIDRIYWDASDRETLTNELLSRGEVRRRVFKFKKKGGQLFWGAVTAKTARDEHGQVMFFDGAIEDLSEVKEKERRLKGEQVFSDIILESFPGQFWLNDENGYCIRWNKNVEKLYGYNKVELQNLRAGGDTPSEGSAAVKKATANILEGGSGKTSFSGDAQSVTINNKEYLACVELDISKVKEVEEKLEEVLEENRRLKELLKTESSSEQDKVSDNTTLQEVESSHILNNLKRANWVIEGKSGAALMLGLNPSTLRGRMRKLGICRPEKVSQT